MANRRPSPVTGNRWVVEYSDRNTVPLSPQRNQDMVDSTSANPSLVHKDSQNTQNTSKPAEQHVALDPGAHPTSNSSPCKDVSMEQIGNPISPDGLVITDSKRRRTDPNGPLVEPSPMLFDFNGPDYSILTRNGDSQASTAHRNDIDDTIIFHQYSTMDCNGRF
nr:uncharacterized protein LOC109173053 [Ipomoea trifida]